ncbi:MAG: alanine racemase [bacterium]|nr:alanine racemase [bacterium]
MRELRTWIEIDEKALRHNVAEFLKLIPKRTRFMAVVKSNAYGHGLVTVAQSLANLTPDTYHLSPRLWFGVDSIVEGLRLRREGIKNPILVLGSTLPARIPEAAEHAIALAVSNFESLRAHASVKNRPAFHLKIDTGMHRQGFFPHEIKKAAAFLKASRLRPEGIFTHFASAKDIAYPTYTLEQLKKFKDADRELQKNGFTNMMRHAAASGGALLFPESHLDMVRIGMAMYGYWPSEESRIKNKELRVTLKPVLIWKTVVAEIKKIPKGAYVGYDCTERVSRNTTMAVLPIGYWHGYDRGLSSTGEVLIRGKRARVLGRVSMDMIVVDATDISGIKVADEVVLIGKQGKDTVWGDAMALKISTSQYEVLTRINPLVKRIIV